MRRSLPADCLSALEGCVNLLGRDVAEVRWHVGAHGVPGLDVWVEARSDLLATNDLQGTGCGVLGCGVMGSGVRGKG